MAYQEHLSQPDDVEPKPFIPGVWHPVRNGAIMGLRNTAFPRTRVKRRPGRLPRGNIHRRFIVYSSAAFRVPMNRRQGALGTCIGSSERRAEQANPGGEAGTMDEAIVGMDGVRREDGVAMA